MKPLLGEHKASAEWYTPGYIWQKVYNTFTSTEVYDPCSINGSGGLEADWSQHKFIYCNPPTPAAEWALKALDTDTNIIFAAFSINVLTQVNQLQDYPVCWVRKRIKWIDGRPGKNSSSPSHYSAFVLITKDDELKANFKANFSDLGNVRLSYVI